MFNEIFEAMRNIDSKVSFLPSYEGKGIRITTVIEKTIQSKPDLHDKIWKSHGGAAWTDGAYISDNLFKTRLTTPEGVWEYDDVNGLRPVEEGGAYWKRLITTAKDTVGGNERTHMTLEQAKSFLDLNSESR